MAGNTAMEGGGGKTDEKLDVIRSKRKHPDNVKRDAEPKG